MFHHKADGIAAASAPKTFIDLFGRRNSKGGSLFIVKRTKAKIIGASFFQFNKGAYDVNNINAAKNLLYGIL